MQNVGPLTITSSKQRNGRLILFLNITVNVVLMLPLNYDIGFLCGNEGHAIQH